MNWSLDDQGLPLHKGDAGDCAARAFQICTGEAIRDLIGEERVFPKDYYETCKKLLIREDGCVLRYNRPGSNGQPYNNPHDSEWGTSRDQTAPAFLAAWMNNDDATIRLLWNNIRKNWFRFPNNKDVLGPDLWMMFQKAMKTGAFGMWIGEKHVGINAWWRCKQAEKNGDDVGDDILETQELAVCHLQDPAPYSQNARIYYAKNRPCFEYIGGERTLATSYRKIPGNGVQWAFDHYNDEGANPHNEHWRPIISKLIFHGV